MRLKFALTITLRDSQIIDLLVYKIIIDCNTFLDMIEIRKNKVFLTPKKIIYKDFIFYKFLSKIKLMIIDIFFEI
jgi:hypothetical protein